MVEIRINGKPLDLPAGFAIQIEDASPIFNDRGSQSVPVTVPATPRNVHLLQGVHRLDAGTDPRSPQLRATVVCGSYIHTGVVNVTEAGRGSISFNIGFDNSVAYAKWQDRKLSELSTLYTYRPSMLNQPTAEAALLHELYRCYQNPIPTDPWLVFPLAINVEEQGEGTSKRAYWEVLNLPNGDSLHQPTTLKRVIDGNVTTLTAPESYMVSPMLKVSTVLELIFEDLGVEIAEWPFADDADLRRLVVLNNAADACVKGEINLVNLMPDCTVQEFLHALWVRFGMVYNVDHDNRTVYIRLLNDIIGNPECADLTQVMTDFPLIAYEAPKYVKLSAKKSMEQAKPSTDRFEDFAKGRNFGRMKAGFGVQQWKKLPGFAAPNMTGDLSLLPEGPTQEESGGEVRDDYLAFEYVTGNWFLLDTINDKVTKASGSCFDWDPQPQGLEAEELTSEDECVVVSDVNGTLMPLYLFGSRHRNAHISTADGDGKEDKTPLAFAMGMTKRGRTFGRVTSEDVDGRPLLLDDGTTAALSLLFQYRGGLFDRFWRRYDEVLRHGNRSVEVPVILSRHVLPCIDHLHPTEVCNIRCLPDMLTYGLPTGASAKVTLKARTIQTQGDYDIDAEQAVHSMPPTRRALRLNLVSDGFEQIIDLTPFKALAAEMWVAENNYRPRRDEDRGWFKVDERGVEPVGVPTRYGLTWQEDRHIPTPYYVGQYIRVEYQAELTFDIYEVGGPDETMTETAAGSTRQPEPIGRQSIVVPYEVAWEAEWCPV